MNFINKQFALKKAKTVIQRKLLLMSLTIFIFLFSCNPEAQQQVANPIDTIAKEVDHIPVKANIDRELLIQEIKKLNSAMATKDKAAILKYFDFPLADSTVNFFEVDSVFDSKRKLNNGTITKAMFTDSFDSIYRLTEMHEFKNVTKFLSIDELKNQNSLGHENVIKGDPCYGIYGIKIEGREIQINYGTNSNDEYRKAHPNEGETCEEYAVFWILKFDGKRLHIIKHSIAG